MIRSPLGLRLNPARPIRDQIREAARSGAKGVVLDAAGDLAPDRLSETGRRELRHLLRSVELTLIALHLPTRRPFDTIDQLDDRLSRRRDGVRDGLRAGDPPGPRPRRRACPRGGRRAPGSLPRPSASSAAGPITGASGCPRDRHRAGRRPRPVLDASTRSGWRRASTRRACSCTGSTRSPRPREPRPLGRPRLRHRPPRLGIVAAARSARIRLPAGALDWEEYLGALEEIDYRGFLTIWPDPPRDPGRPVHGARRSARAISEGRSDLAGRVLDTPRPRLGWASRRVRCLIREWFPGQSVGLLESSACSLPFEVDAGNSPTRSSDRLAHRPRQEDRWWPPETRSIRRSISRWKRVCR